MGILKSLKTQMMYFDIFYTGNYDFLLQTISNIFFNHRGPGTGKSSVMKMLLRNIDYLKVKMSYPYQPYRIVAPSRNYF